MDALRFGEDQKGIDFFILSLKQLKIKTMKTFLTISWAVLLTALFLTLFYLMGKALIEFGEWLIWRLKLQMKRFKEMRRARRSKSNLKPKTKH